MLSAIYVVLATGAHLVLVAERMPQVNFEAACHAAAGASWRSEDECSQDEKTAKTRLEQEWGSFDADQKGHCMRLQQVGGMPSYVELLTCLEMGKALKELNQRGRANPG